MTTFNILTYNIHKGLNLGNRKLVLQQMKEALHQSDADIVFLQEVSGHNDRSIHAIDQWDTRAQFEFLADERWDYAAYGKNAVYTKGHHGNALLSKYPIVQWNNLNISTNRFEQRGVLHSVLETPGQPLHTFCLHLNLLQRGRDRQIALLIDYIQSLNIEKSPYIICGDFNDWKIKVTEVLSQELGVTEAYFSLHGKHAKTFPSFSPLLRLDRIYVKNITVQACTLTDSIVWKKLSDHVGLHATLAFG